MPRRRSNRTVDKKRYKRNDGSSRQDFAHHHDENVMSLEDDLREQRIRQQEREREQNQLDLELWRQKKKEEQEALEEQNRAQELRQLRQQRATPQNLISRGLSTALVDDYSVRLPASYTLGLVQESRIGHDRQKLRYLWHSQYMLDNTNIHTRAFLLYSKKYNWAARTLPNGVHTSWDLECKYRLHPSARTLDLTMLQKDDHLPMIVSIASNGWNLLRDKEGDQARMFSCNPLDAIRIHDKTACVALLMQHNLTTQLCQGTMAQQKLYLARTNNNHEFIGLSGIELDEIRVNDMCVGEDLVLLATCKNPYIDRFCPLFMPLTPSGEFYDRLQMFNVENFPESDALRVEMICDAEKYIAFGHRNGQVSSMDLRQSRSVCSILHCEKSSTFSEGAAGTPMGSATDLQFLSSSGSKQILVRRSNGSFQLHDLRMSSSSSSTLSARHHNLSSSLTLLWNMMVPPDEISPSLTTRCNGFAVDPIGNQTLVAPYINQSNDAMLGVWSLKTGFMVGSRLLKKSLAKDDAMFVELCQKSTPCYNTHRHDTTRTTMSDSSSSSPSSSSFSLWLKCGTHSQQPVTSKVGGLCRVSFPGRWC